MTGALNLTAHMIRRRMIELTKARLDDPPRYPVVRSTIEVGGVLDIKSLDEKRAVSTIDAAYWNVIERLLSFGVDPGVGVFSLSEGETLTNDVNGMSAVRLVLTWSVPEVVKA